jgi:osmoprotectant transport system ATP-binding protein
VDKQLGNAIEFERVFYEVDGSRALVRDLSFTVANAETLILLGESGSGKTTTLKLINRLLSPTRGVVRVHGVATTEWDPTKLRRGIGYAIQDAGLFPHYTVYQNAAVVPRLEGWNRERISLRVTEVLRTVGLESDEFAKRYPDQLSGGQRQRVGLARALAADPRILLLDEPFGAIDAITRAQLQRDFKDLQQQLAKTVVFVTHDLAEALMLGSRIALMHQGRLTGIYTPPEFLSSTDALVRSYLNTIRVQSGLERCA